jgi:arylsulfatase A-like enzyme
VKPNILWIVTTQWRAQALGFAGDPNARTPALDALAAESVAYTQAVTPHPFGPFARAAMLTGVESPQNGVQDYFDPLPDDAPTIARALNACSYETIFFGKWHLAARDRAAPLTGEAHAKAVVPPGSRGGFGFWEGFESGFLLNDPWLHGTRLPEPVQFKGYQSSVVCSRALEKLSSSRGPWFAMVSLEAPHPPYGAPADGVRPPDAGDIELRVNVTEGAEARARSDLSGYYAHIEATDRAIGALVAGLPRETIIVFTSVHGDMHGSHGLFRKGWPHEESVRVPLLVRTGGPSRRDDRAITLTDLGAMTLAWAKKGPGTELPSVERFSRISMPSVVALPDQCDRSWTGLRSSTRKLVVGPDGEPWLFFDLESDPLELSNLAREPASREEIEALRQRLPVSF